jgi:hypothetical protein
MNVAPVDSLDGPLAKVLAAAGPRREKAGNGWLVLCPAHGDRSPSLSVGVGRDGRVVLRCQAGCATDDVVKELGLKMSDLFNEKLESQRETFSLADFAALKKLPLDALARFGVSDGKYYDRDCVRFEYRLLSGAMGRTRVRTARSGEQRFKWDGKDGKISAYTPDRCELAQAEGYALLVEGESDTLTCLAAELPAIGIPGANSAHSLDVEHVKGLRTLFIVQEPDAGGAAFVAGLKQRLKTLGFTAPVHVMQLPEAKDCSALYMRDPAAFAATMHGVMRVASAPPKERVEWIGTADIFAPLPPTEWRVRGLQIAPGRPTLLAGYGASAKTLSSQALGLALASGSPVWGHFATEPGEVRHLDYEQGAHATRLRYQRLARGHGITQQALGGRLKLSVFPEVFLDCADAVDAYAKACDGASLVIIDALRGATPTRDENDSSIRACLDNLSRVSEKTGAAFVVLHHAGKPKDSHANDPRTLARGSSAIFDACGCVLVVVAGKTRQDPRKVSQVKMPAEAIGPGIEDFMLAVEDVPTSDNDNTACPVRVMYRAAELVSPVMQADAKYERTARQLLDYVRANPDTTQNQIALKSGVNRRLAIDTLNELVEEGRLAALPGPNNAKLYRTTGAP